MLAKVHPIRWLRRVERLLTGVLFLGAAGCVPTVPSPKCADGISDCLAACESESPVEKEFSRLEGGGRSSSTPCEQRCHSRCGGSVGPATTPVPANPAGTTPTGAAVATPTPAPPPVEPPPEPTVERTSQSETSDLQE